VIKAIKMEQLMEIRDQAAAFVVSTDLGRPSFLWDILAQSPGGALKHPATPDKEQIGHMFTSQLIEQNAKVVIFAARKSSSNDRTCSG
jgi:hypothetical protein